MGIKVVATQIGYYDHGRRKVGDVFEIRDQQAFSHKWMEKLSDKKKRLAAEAAAEEGETDELPKPKGRANDKSPV